MVPRFEATAVSGILMEMQILGPTPDLLNPKLWDETLEVILTPDKV